MKFKVELIINFDQTSNKFKIENSNISIIDIGDPRTGPVVTLENNRLVFNREALKFLNKSEGDRIGISYRILSDGLLHPIFDLEQGNKITKSGTLSCRGSANEILSKYGKNFIIENIDDEFVLTDLKFKELVREEDPHIVLPSIEEEEDMQSSSDTEDLLDELDTLFDEEPKKEYKDFFGNSEDNKELKDIDFTSLIE